MSKVLTLEKSDPVAYDLFLLCALRTPAGEGGCAKEVFPTSTGAAEGEGASPAPAAAFLSSVPPPLTSEPILLCPCPLLGEASSFFSSTAGFVFMLCDPSKFGSIPFDLIHCPKISLYAFVRAKKDSKKCFFPVPFLVTSTPTGNFFSMLRISAYGMTTFFFVPRTFE